LQRQAEKQLLMAIRAGERAACEKLVKDHYQAVYRFLFHLTGDVGAADDLTQETFAAAWAGMADFKGRGRITGWLHRIAYGKFVDAQRKKQRHGNLKRQLKYESARRPDETNPLGRLMTEERSGVIYQALRELSYEDHVIIVLHYFQDMSYREMAAVLDQPTGTVKWKTSRALKELKKILIKEYEP